MKRYQDYVIKDGKFIGKFEDMYQKFDDPWHQASNEYNSNSYSRNFAILNIRRYGIKSLVEFGCGLGYCTDLIHRSTGIKIKGVDISPTAIAKAKKPWPNLDFAVDNIQNIQNYSDFEEYYLLR
ncbi:MAG: class I SAM-dependent methyltransferase [Methanophagales archaeon]|nr:class I SAM-dependent methyltransferase [Methanophagales archaeon]